MKTATCILLSFSILFAGCYTQSSITKDEGAPDDRKVFFYLKDGSCIESFAKQHRRVEEGYQVSGTIQKGGKLWFPPPPTTPMVFDGLVLDNDIDRLEVLEYNVVGPLLWGLVGVAVAVASIGLVTSLPKF